MTERKPDGYWQDPNNRKVVIDDLLEEFGYLPSERQLRRLGRFSLIKVIYHCGGFRKLRETLGEPVKKRTTEYWQDFANIKAELEAIRRQLGHFPSQSELYSLKKAALLSAIARHHGGLIEVKKSFQVEDTARPRGYWQIWENAELELEEVIKRNNGEFPGLEIMNQLGYSRLASALQRHHGGINAVRKRMGYGDPIQKPANYWKDWNNIVRELEEIIQKVGHFPTYSELNTMGKYGLTLAFSKYHGGIDAVRKKLQQEGAVPSEKEQLEQLVERYIAS